MSEQDEQMENVDAPEPEEMAEVEEGAEETAAEVEEEVEETAAEVEVEEAEPGPEEMPKIDLNTATEEELRQLPGIGPALAARIVNYREEVHPFEEPIELAAVPGISRAMYEQIADRLTVSAAAPAVVEAAQAEAETEAEAERAPILEPAPEPEEVEVEEVPTPWPMPAPQIVQGDGWGRLLLVGLVSALVGAALALAVVLLLNGSLNVRRVAVQDMRADAFRLEGEIKSLHSDLEWVQGRVEAINDLALQLRETNGQVEALGRELASARQEMGRMAQALEATQTEFGNVYQELEVVRGNVDTMERRLGEVAEQLGQAQEQLDVLRMATARFDTFLNGLRELLDQTAGEGSPAAPPRRQTPTPTPWETPTPSSMVTVIPRPSPTPTP